MSVALANESFHLSEDVWDELSAINEVLKIMSDKMDYLQTENLTMSDAYGAWIETEGRLKTMPNNPSAVLMLKQLTKRRDEFFIVNNIVMYSAMFLDPRFQFMLNANQKNDVFKHLTYLNQKLNLKESAHEPQCTILATPTLQREPDRSGNVLEQILHQHELSLNSVACTSQTVSTSNALQIEFEKFDGIGRSHADSGVRSFWKTGKFEYPILFKLSQLVLAVPPTEVAVERNFSALDFILNKRRNRLTDLNLETILLLKLNKSVFYESFENDDFTFE